MMDKTAEATMHAAPPKPRRKPRRVLWALLLVFVLFCLASIWMPLPGYLMRMAETIASHGFKSETLAQLKQDTVWFKRFFTGPPRDAEMIEFLRTYRQDFKRLVELFRDNAGFNPPPSQQELPEFRELREKLGLKVGLSGYSSSYSVYADPKKDTERKRQFGYGYGHFGTYGVRIIAKDYAMHPWSSSRRQWTKSYLYLPPLTVTNSLGGSMRNLNDVKADSLDVIPPEVEHSLGITECAIRQLDDTWFIRLCGSLD